MEEFKSQQGGTLTDQQKNLMETYEEKRKLRLQEAKHNDPLQDNVLFQAKTIYHGTGAGSNRNKSFVEAPSYLRNKDHDCFIPKKWLHTWSGHDKGVQRIKFFPRTGHLLLSASHDGTVKIWDVMTHRKCIRTY